MSQRMNILKSVSTMIDFIKEKTRTNIVQANMGDKLSIDEESLRRVLNIIDQSISQAYSQAYSSVETAARDLSSQEE